MLYELTKTNKNDPIPKETTLIDISSFEFVFDLPESVFSLKNWIYFSFINENTGIVSRFLGNPKTCL